MQPTRSIVLTLSREVMTEPVVSANKTQITDRVAEYWEIETIEPDPWNNAPPQAGADIVILRYGVWCLAAESF